MPDAHTRSLFGESPDAPPERAVARRLTRNKPASKAEQAFQRLVAKIERLRGQLQEWQAFQARYNERLNTEYMPLRATLRLRQREMVELIDKLLSRPSPGRRMGRRQRDKLVQILLNLVDGLLADGDETDDLLVALHDRYSDVSHAQAREDEIDLTRALLGDVFGIDVGDDHGASSVEELLQGAYEKLRERNEREAPQPADDGEDPVPSGNGRHAHAAAARAEAARVRREQAAKEVGQSLRDVYRKLASALHPDRETDAGERERKTRMMQRVNQAYDARDLLTLLGLQLEVEQIDAAHLANATPQRVAHYNEILREQVAELETELASFVAPFSDMLGRAKAMPVPSDVDRQLSIDIAQLRLTIRQLEGDLVAFRDPKRLRAELEHFSLDEDEDDEDEALLSSLLEMMGTAATTQPGGRKGRKKKRG